MRSALTALARMPSAPQSSAYCFIKASVADFGKPIRAEIPARIHRLLRDVEQQAAAEALRLHRPHRVLRDMLMSEEIELEGAAQQFVVDRSDIALPRGAGIGDDNVDAAEGLGDAVERFAHLRRFGDIALDGQHAPAARFGNVAIEDRDLGPFLREGLAVAAPIPLAPPVTTAMWRARRGAAPLPSLACSSDQYSTSNMSDSETHS